MKALKSAIEYFWRTGVRERIAYVRQRSTFRIYGKSENGTSIVVFLAAETPAEIYKFQTEREAAAKTVSVTSLQIEPLLVRQLEKACAGNVSRAWQVLCYP